ncbi:MAG: HD domain-containing protein [Anaerolineaceae bacterium]|nr:HD domain-containing protein [Anaerolineaceae bacterium]MBN2676862.1 HD domain-containing protein [Anaerolineaceae bacterium]
MKKNSTEPLHTIITHMLLSQQTLFILLVIMVFAVSSHWSAKIAIQQARHSTVLIARNVSDYLNRTEHALIALAVTEPTQTGLDSLRAGFNEFDTIYFIQSNGRLEKISPRTSLITVGMDMSSQPYFHPDLSGLKISTPFTSSRTGKPTVYMSLPLRQGEGMIVGEVNLSELQQQIIDETIPITGFSYIIDHNGYFIAHWDADKVASQENIRGTDLYQITLEGTSEPVYSWDEGLSLYTIYTVEPIPNTEWYTINQLPFWTVYAPFLIPAIIGLLTALVLIFLSIRQQRHMISRRVIDPLEFLTDQARRISAGTYLDLDAHPAAPEAYTEVHELMNSISMMEESVRTREVENYRLLSDVKRHLRQERLLRDIDDAFKHFGNLDETLNLLLTKINTHLSIDASSIYIHDSKKACMRSYCRLGFSNPPDLDISSTLEKYISKHIQDNALIQVPSLEKAREPAFRLIQKTENLHSFIGIPLFARGQLIGFLNMFTRSVYSPADEEIEFLKMVGTHTALAIDSTLMFSDLQSSNLEMIKAYDSTLEGWSRAMDLRDRETEGHTQRVTEMSEQLAKQMGIPDEHLIHIRRGALLHDIGKIAVPDSILLKAGPLTPEEWEIMRYHPQYARDFLMEIEYLRPAMDIPSHHHEHWDGSGYPDHLVGEDIPLAARIFSVIDVWDALTSDRPYREAWTTQRTLDYIVRQSGKYFDPAVVKEFLKIVPRQNGTQASK